MKTSPFRGHSLFQKSYAREERSCMQNVHFLQTRRTAVFPFLKKRLSANRKMASMVPHDESQDHGKGGLSLRGVAVTTETATTAKTVTVVSWYCIL